MFWEGLTCRGTKGRTRAVRELGAGVGGSTGKALQELVSVG